MTTGDLQIPKNSKKINSVLTKNPDVIGFFDEFSPQSTANT